MYMYKFVDCLTHNGCDIHVIARLEKPWDIISWRCTVRLNRHDRLFTPYFFSKEDAIANAKKVADEWGPIESNRRS